MKKIFNTYQEVINLQINGLMELKKNFSSSFLKAIKIISKCKSKVILIGVGKSGIIATKIASTLSSVGTPSYSISANDCSHGDLGSINKTDVLILISNSGDSIELRNIIVYAKKYKIPLISIVSKKNSMLYKSSNIRLLIPESKEAGYNIVPTTSTTMQLAMGDAIAISVMKYKNFSKLDFKKFHPAGSLGLKLKTVEDLMSVKKSIPFIDENKTILDGLKIINKKKLGILIAKNQKGFTTGVFTDGDIKRTISKKIDIKTNSIKKFMTKNPLSVEKNTLASEALHIMNKRRVTSLCVHEFFNKKKTIGIIHIHKILSSNIR
jgi:arabinose-5-phosphate isomerase